MDGAETALRWQRTTCQAALDPGNEIVAMFFDVGSPSIRSASARLPEIFGIERVGCLADLLGEAIRPGRRFDAVIVSGADRLSRRFVAVRQIAGLMTAAELEVRLADQPHPVTGAAGWLVGDVCPTPSWAAGRPYCSACPDPRR